MFAVSLEDGSNRVDLGRGSEDILGDLACFGVDSHASCSFGIESEAEPIGEVHRKFLDDGILHEFFSEDTSSGRDSDEKLALVIELQVVCVAKQIAD